MGYHSVVCVKQVPDTKNITGEAMKQDGTVNRVALPAIFNPEDMNALEQALAVRETYGGTVTVVTMGLPKACAVLRESLYRGADRGILISDRRAAGSDTLATSYILSCAVRKLNPDLVFCGRQAIDGDTAQVGPQLAEKIDFTQFTYVDEFIGIEGRAVTVRRNLGNGWEVARADMPVIMTVMDTANVPRPQAAKRMMKFKKARSRAEVEGELKGQMPDASKEEVAAAADEQCARREAKGLLLETWDLDALDADLNWCGLKGSPTKVHRIQSIVLKGGDYKQYDSTTAGVSALVAELIKDQTMG